MNNSGLIRPIRLIEVFVLSLLGSLMGLLLTRLGSMVMNPYLQNKIGIRLDVRVLSLNEIYVTLIVIAVSLFACLLPAWKMQNQALKDGLAPRL